MKKKKLIFIIIVSVVIIGSLIYCSIYFYDRYSNRYLTKARAYYKLGENKNALEQYKLHLLLHPDDFWAKLKYADVLIEEKSYDKAITVLTITTYETEFLIDKAIFNSAKLKLNLVIGEYAHNKLDEGEKYFDKNAWEAARICFIKSIELFLRKDENYDSSDFIGGIRYNIAVAYYNEGLYYRAKEMLLEIKKKNPNFSPELVRDLLNKINRISK